MARLVVDLPNGHSAPLTTTDLPRYMRDRLPTLPTAKAGGAGPAQADGSGLPNHLITTETHLDPVPVR